MGVVAEAVEVIHQAWPWFWPCVGGVFGAVLGSFGTCLRYRLPRNISLRHPPSSCPQCGHVLGVPDLVPVLSWLALRGRCRFCRGPIPWQNLVLEIAMAALGAAAVWWVLNCIA